MKPLNWHCPYCNHKVTITDNLYSQSFHRLTIENSEGKVGLYSQFLICPNVECKKPTLNVAVREWSTIEGSVRYGNTLIQRRLLPAGDARPFPDYVPLAIRRDYEEACLIRDLSPKSAATLARRALQGILRDFYGVKAGRLVDEIEALEDSMDLELLDAIHGVRKVGNIGAHMEADINTIVDVDPDEARLLTELVETMIEETYERREQRRARLQKVSELSKEKDKERRKPGVPPGLGAKVPSSD